MRFVASLRNRVLVVGRLHLYLVDDAAFHLINRWTTPPEGPDAIPYGPGWWLHLGNLVVNWVPRLRS